MGTQQKHMNRYSAGTIIRREVDPGMEMFRIQVDYKICCRLDKTNLWHILLHNQQSDFRTPRNNAQSPRFPNSKSLLEIYREKRYN
jgi:hypothetical protein